VKQHRRREFNSSVHMAGFKDVTLHGMLWLVGVEVRFLDMRRGSLIPVLKQYLPKDIFNMDGIHYL
jgi:hypothetical protein